VAAAFQYDGGMEEKDRLDLALFRYSVLGQLIGSRLEHGDVEKLCREAAERHWQRPDGTVDQIPAATIRNWYYAYRARGFDGLKPKDRRDLGTSDIRPDLADLVVRAKRERPRRSISRIIRMLQRAQRCRPDELSKSAVHRLLEREGISGRPQRGPAAERRSFIYEFPGDLLIGDALRPRRPVLDSAGRQRKVILFSQIDCATRYVPESFFAFGAGESAVSHELGLKRALRVHGLWLKYYVDLGPAYVARSLKLICAELGMQLLHAGAGDAAAKGAIEKFNRTWREEVEDELPDHPIPLTELEAKHQAWLARDYHARVHTTTQRCPRDHWLELCGHLRPLPAGANLDEVFLHRVDRTVSKVGTVRWAGGRLEVVPELSERRVELRYEPSAPDALPKVFVNNKFVCDTVPLDLHRNAHRKRRRDLGKPDPRVEPTGISPLDDLVAEHQRLAAPLSFLAEKEPLDEADPLED